jgi:hypothetical protein
MPKHIDNPPILTENLLDAIDRNPALPDTLLATVRSLIRDWDAVAPDQRPGFDALEAVWMRERRPAFQAAQARPQSVAALLEILITEGQIDPFTGLDSDNADEHLLTSRRQSSIDLRRRLRANLRMVQGEVAAANEFPVFVRAIALGFGWHEPLPIGGSLDGLAETALPEHLLTGYRVASIMAGSRADSGGAALEQDTSFKVISDGIVRCLRSRLINGVLKDESAEFAKRVIRIIELERVVRGMMALLATDQAPPNEAEIESWFAPHHFEDGPLSHLRKYAALGTPLIDLVGRSEDAEVRREIERVMKNDAHRLPGFPSVEATSRRPSDLLRRIRFLVRSMVLRSQQPGSRTVFRKFVHGLLAHGVGDVRLAAARLAFERPPVLGLQRRVVSDLANFVQWSGLGESRSPRSHEGLTALKEAALIEIDTWGRDRDIDCPHLLMAIRATLGELEERNELAEHELVRAVFDRVVCARGRDQHRFGRGEERRQFFEELDAIHMESDDPLVAAVRGGLVSFRTYVRANYHREFDRDRLRDLVGLVRKIEMGDDDEDGPCGEWLKSWAYVDISGVDPRGPVPSRTFESRGQVAPRVQGMSAPHLVSAVRAEPLERDEGPAGEPWVFSLADAASHGLGSALEALKELSAAADAPTVFQMSSRDAVGRSIGMVIAQTCSEEIVTQLFGGRRAFVLSMDSSVDGVSPVMAAARFARDEKYAAKRGLETVIECSGDTGLDSRDRRGWRAIHHAMAAGNLEAARVLLARAPEAALVQGGDTTTFLIEAFRCSSVSGADRSQVIGFARELLDSMQPDQIGRVLAFPGNSTGTITPEGTRLSILSAVLESKGHWPEFMALVEAHPKQAAGIWQHVGAEALRKLLASPDPIQLSQFCDCVNKAGPNELKTLVKSLDDAPVSVRIARGAISRTMVDAARQKFIDLHRFGVLDVTQRAPDSGGTMFHVLVDSMETARLEQDPARDADAYALAMNVLTMVPAKDAKNAVLTVNFERETAIWQAVRHGEMALALAYARALGWPSDAAGQARRWAGAAKVIMNPDRFQDGIGDRYRVRLGTGGLLEVALKDGVAFSLSSTALPPDIDNRAAREWLRRHASEIASQLQSRIGAHHQISFYDFPNLLSHLTDEETDQDSVSEMDKDTVSEMDDETQR